ncbi:hexitol phosphatase HxpB [Sphingobacterium sp. DR205]|nr:hexitol phosphatase HxpB [Sphingobacterium sp. DR205]
MIEAVIFDMDGLLIDSEPFWRIAEKEVFGSVGIQVTASQASLTSRMTTKEVTEYWFNFKPWKDKRLAHIEQQVIKRVGELIDCDGQTLPGVIETLERFKRAGCKIGLATNSPAVLMSQVLSKLEIGHYFDITLSADHVRKGKPSPDIYLKMASSLSVDPSRCIVLEDSTSGIAAARAAGMAVIAVVGQYFYDNIEFDIADVRIGSLLDFYDDQINILNKMLKYRACK